MTTPPSEQGAAALAPCPFCGAVGLDFGEGSTFRWITAECTGCGATTGETRIQTFGEGSRDEWLAVARNDAIAAWNRRASLPSSEGAAHQQAQVAAEPVFLVVQHHSLKGKLKPYYGHSLCDVLSVHASEALAEAARSAVEEKFHEEFPGHRTYDFDPMRVWLVQKMDMSVPPPEQSSAAPVVEPGAQAGREATVFWFMRDNHTFRRLTGQPEDMVAQALEEFDAGYSGGSIFARPNPTGMAVHAQGPELREKFAKAALIFIEAHAARATQGDRNGS